MENLSSLRISHSAFEKKFGATLDTQAFPYEAGWSTKMSQSNAEYGKERLKENVRFILGVKDKEDWVYNLNIGNVMHLLPIDLQELNLHLDNSHELSRDALLEKVRIFLNI